MKSDRPRKGVQVLSDDEQTVLYKILDSNWFRKSFTERMEFWKQNGRAIGSLKDVGEYVEEIATIATVFGKAFPGVSPSAKEVLSEKNFDQFMEKWFNTALKHRPRLIAVAHRTSVGYRNRIPYEGETILTRNTLDHPSLPPLCVPLSLADKLSRVGRIQLTLLLQLFESLEEALDPQQLDQEVQFQKLVAATASQDTSKFLYNGTVNRSIPYSVYMTPPERDENDAGQEPSTSIFVSWETPSEGIASTLMNDYFSMPNNAREGIRNLVLWAYWTGVRQYIERPLAELFPREDLQSVIDKNKSFLQDVIIRARERKDDRQVLGEKAILQLLSLTEELINKDNLADFLRHSIKSRAQVDELTRTILVVHGNYTGAGELLFRNLTHELGERTIDGLIATGQQESLKQLIPRHMLDALDVWNAFLSQILSTQDDDTVFSGIRGRFEESKERLRTYLEFAPGLASLLKKRKIGIVYLWGTQ